MSGTFNDRGELEPTAAAIILCVGKKGSGKSIMAMTIASSWPYDMVVIDVAGDDGPMPRKPGTGTHDIHELTGTVEELPRKWPEYLRSDPPRPMILRYCPDAGSPTMLEDIDAVVGLAFGHSSRDKPVMLVIHEANAAAPVNKTPPHMRRTLRQSRHQGLTAVLCEPRTMHIDRLVLQQADLVYVFELQNPDDRRRVADSIGWDPRGFDESVTELGRYEYVRFDAREEKPENDDDEDMRLTSWPPLPEDVVAATKRWTEGTEPKQVP